VAEQLRLLVDNLFDARQYPSHTVSGSTEATGFEAYHVATGRRHAADRWSPTTANASSYVQVRCNTIRAADTLIVDRNSNLISNARAGNTSAVTLLASGDNFVTTRSIASLNMPTIPGGLPSEAYGCVTDEDAWGKTFTVDGAYDWRFHLEALGTGVTPQVGGLWLGKAWAPSSTVLAMPYEDEVTVVGGAESMAPSGWVGAARPSRVRQGSLHIRPKDETNNDMLAYTLGMLARGFPFWLAFRQTDFPWRMMLARCPKGALAWVYDNRDWHLSRTIDVPFIEEQASY
jgi:hypothetical protein